MIVLTTDCVLGVAVNVRMDGAEIFVILRSVRPHWIATMARVLRVNASACLVGRANFARRVSVLALPSPSTIFLLLFCE
jgi:hypothetical protein